MSRAKGKAVTFKGWLRNQERRQDPVGDFARDWCDDPDAPPVFSHRQVERHLLGLDVGEDVHAASRRAWDEWMVVRHVAPKRKPRKKA